MDEDINREFWATWLALSITLAELREVMECRCGEPAYPGYIQYWRKRAEREDRWAHTRHNEHKS